MEKLAFALVTAVHKLKPYPLRRAMSSAEAAGRMALWTIELRGKKEPPMGDTHGRVRGAGIILLSPEGDKVQCMIRLNFPVTNNEVEYKALIAGLDLAQAAGATDAMVRCDSQVVTSQINGCYECKGERMKEYLEQVKNWMRNINVEFVQILKEENEQADRLARAASADRN
ncbi:uncharacterized protein LOC142616336 [Castanea sativa]|uniref:uncharacterized protein LOC142616336 n=1 Tax=Castanea sativa TaxID=21020 RepID=UPI003F652744